MERGEYFYYTLTSSSKILCIYAYIKLKYNKKKRIIKAMQVDVIHWTTQSQNYTKNISMQANYTSHGGGNPSTCYKQPD